MVLPTLKKALGALVLISSASLAGTVTLIRMTPADIDRIPATAPAAGTSGLSSIRMRLLRGDPSRPGPYTISLSVPPDTRIAPHTHRDERSAVVAAGEWFIGYGKKPDEASFKKLTAASFYTEPAGVPHFARTGREGAVVYISGTGPSDTVYLK